MAFLLFQWAGYIRQPNGVREGYRLRLHWLSALLSKTKSRNLSINEVPVVKKEGNKMKFAGMRREVAAQRA